MSYLEPALPLLLLIGFAGLVRLWRNAPKGRRPWLPAISLFGILLLSLNAAAWLFSRPLEIWYSEDPVLEGSAEAIVVLAGAVSVPLPNRPYPLAGQDTYARLQRAVWLFRNWRPVPILACGGGRNGEWYARTIRHVLESEGIPSDLIWTESQSRNTYENALYGAEILRRRGITRIALVIEAGSMPRATASFRKQGISVLPAPSGYTRLNRELTDFFPTWGAIETNGDTLHELVGLLWYRLRGRI